MWPDAVIHQGYGLHSLRPQSDLRVLAVLSQSDPGRALELLWQLCARLQRLGYPVAVLDGTALETPEAPGLQQLLSPAAWPGLQTLGADTAAAGALTVLPAAYGLRQLARRAAHDPAQALRSLQPPLRAYAAVMLYAPEQWLAPLLAGSGARPLIVTGPGAQGMVRGYRQLKYLALHGGLRCSVASLLAPGAHERARRQSREALAALQASAERLLGLTPHTTLVSPTQDADLTRLALQLLENASTISEAMPVWHTPVAQPLPMDRSH